MLSKSCQTQFLRNKMRRHKTFRLMKNTILFLVVVLSLFTTTAIAQETNSLHSPKKWEFGLQLSKGVGATVLSKYSIENGLFTGSEHYHFSTSTTKLGLSTTRKEIFKGVDLNLEAGLLLLGNLNKQSFKYGSIYFSVLPQFKVNDRLSIIGGVTGIIPYYGSIYDKLPLIYLSAGVDFKLNKRWSVNAMYHHSLQSPESYQSATQISTTQFRPGIELGLKFRFGKM